MPSLFDTEWDPAVAERVRYEEGIEDGREEGREEGQEKKALEIARKLKNIGLSLSEIAEATGLEMDVIQNIQSQL